MDCQIHIDSSFSCSFCKGKNEMCHSRRQHINGLVSAPENKIDLVLLPEDILLKTFSFLDLKELMVVRCVSRIWRRVAQDKLLWRSVNLSCKRIQVGDWIFRLPVSIRKSVKIMNLMWAYVALPAFNLVKVQFPNVELMLMQHCKFAISFGDEETRRQPLQSSLRVLDVRNVHGRWFDDTVAETMMINMEGMAFSQTMPGDWISRLSHTWLPKLRVLHIQNNPSLSDSFLSSLILNTPKLESINVHGCMYVTGSFLKDAIDKLPDLVSLDLNGTRLDGAKVRDADWSKSSIRNLNVSFCCKLSENDLKFILSKLKHLRLLQASFCGWGRALTDEAIASFCGTNKRTSLESLDIQSTFGMSAKSLSELCRSSSCLRHLRVGTMMKTNKELVMVLENAPNLKALSIQMGDSRFSAAFLFNTLAVHCKKLETIFLYNFSFDTCPEAVLHESLVNLFTSCGKLKNFFTGGYPFKQRETIDAIVSRIASSLGRRLNCKRPVQVIPQPEASFDRLLCATISQRTYNAPTLKRSLESAVNCQAFYKSGIQKLDDYHFFLLRNS